jgi:hypothetical protein
MTTQPITPNARPAMQGRSNDTERAASALFRALGGEAAEKAIERQQSLDLECDKLIARLQAKLDRAALSNPLNIASAVIRAQAGLGKGGAE